MKCVRNIYSDPGDRCTLVQIPDCEQEVSYNVRTRIPWSCEFHQKSFHLSNILVPYVTQTPCSIVSRILGEVRVGGVKVKTKREHNLAQAP